MTQLTVTALVGWLAALGLQARIDDISLVHLSIEPAPCWRASEKRWAHKRAGLGPPTLPPND